MNKKSNHHILRAIWFILNRFSTETTTIEIITSGQPLYNCSAEDQRNVTWSGGPWDNVTKECDEGLLTDETFTNGQKRKYLINLTLICC